ncbi:MAG: PqqD family peptide modification chaperone [Dehalococcoidales bacterium]
MKVLLIFPPVWAPYRPYLGLPSLTAYLKEHGVDVIQKDLNIEITNMLLSQKHLESVGKKLNGRFNLINSKNMLSAGIEQKYYSDLYKAKSSAHYLAETIEESKNVFRGSDFYDINKLSRAREKQKNAQNIVSVNSFPSGQDLFWPVNIKFHRTYADIKKITANRAENPFYTIYEDHFIPYLLKEKPDIIGISIVGETQWVPALTLSRMIKSIYKRGHITIGGYTTTVLSESFEKYPDLFTTFFDSAIIDEGEIPLLKLVEAISKGKSLCEVPNLVYADGGKVVSNEGTFPEDVNNLPTPCFDGMPLDLYLSPEPVLPILSSRGCYWSKCAFCSHNEVYRCNYQVRDAKKVVDDIKKLSELYNVRHFAFSDEAISPASANRLSDEIIQSGLDIRCSTNIRLEPQLKPELCQKMYKAGFRLLYLGLESGSNRVLDHMQKGITKEVAAEVCKNLHNAGIWAHLYTFLGFPTETKEEALETIDFLIDNKDVVSSFYIGSFLLNKGAVMLKQPEKYGIAGFDSGPHTDFSLAFNHEVSSGLSFAEADEMSKKYQAEIVNSRPGNEVFKIDYEEILLYLSHYEKTDPWLLSLGKPETTNLGNRESVISGKSIPVLKPYVIFESINFNIFDILSGAVESPKSALLPQKISLVFDPVKSNIQAINPLFIEILKLCNGINSVSQIAYELSMNYDGDVDKIEQDCTRLLEFLLENDILEMR